MNRLIHAEIRKLTSTTSVRIAVAGALLAAPLVTVINTYTAGTKSQPALTTRAGLHHVLNSAPLTTMVMLALGLVAVAGEYRHGTIVSTFLIEPRRGRVMAAKLAVLAGLGAAVAGAAFGLAVAGAVPALAAHHIHHLPSDTVQMLVGAMVEGAVFAVIGVALGAFTRNTVAGVVGAVVWVAVIEAMVLHAIVPNLTRWLPSGTAMALDRTSDNPGKLLAPVVAGTVLLAYAAGFAIVGARRVITSDTP